jgi:hypothetical protein
LVTEINQKLSASVGNIAKKKIRLLDNVCHMQRCCHKNGPAADTDKKTNSLNYDILIIDFMHPPILSIYKMVEKSLPTQLVFIFSNMSLFNQSNSSAKPKKPVNANTKNVIDEEFELAISLTIAGAANAGAANKPSPKAINPNAPISVSRFDILYPL